MGALFSRVGLSKNRSGERLRTAPARKNDKNRFRRRLRTHFFGSGPIFCRFWAPGRTPKLPKKRPRATRGLFFDHIFPIFSGFLHSGVFRKGPGPILEAPGTLPDQISVDFVTLFCRCRRDLVGVCRVPPGCCRDPHPTSVTHSPGFPWGTAISRSDLN